MSRRQDHPHIDLTKPSVPALVFLLRHREFWPDGFVWDYSNCGTCAMGLAIQLWKLKWRPFFFSPPCGPMGLDEYLDTVRKPLGLGRAEAKSVFLNVVGNDRATVTPEKVADALEQLAGR